MNYSTKAGKRKGLGMSLMWGRHEIQYIIIPGTEGSSSVSLRETHNNAATKCWTMEPQFLSYIATRKACSG